MPLDQKGIQRAVQVKLGEALRSQYELARPLSDQLDALLKELERRGSDRGAPKETKPSAALPRKRNLLGGAGRRSIKPRMTITGRGALAAE